MRTDIQRGIGMGKVLLVLSGLALATVIVIDEIIVPASGIVSEEAGIAGDDLTAIPELQIDALPPMERFSEVIERPLFSPTRRPPADSEATATSKRTVAPSRDLTLRGIIISDGSKMALVQSGKEKTYLRVAEGDLLGHRLVVAIENDHVSLAAGGVEQILWLKDLTGRDRRRLLPATAQRERTQETTRADIGAPRGVRNDLPAAGASGGPQQPSESSGPKQDQ